MASQVIEQKKAELSKKEAQIQNALKENYESLGRLLCDNAKYFEIATTDERAASVNDSAKKIIARIEQDRTALSEIEKEKTELDSLRTCPKCGNIVGDDELFCGNCGERIIKVVPATDDGVCPQCGKPKKGNGDFCVFCGFKFNNAKPDTDTSEANQRHCFNCGTILAPDVLFCHVCGSKNENILNKK